VNPDKHHWGFSLQDLRQILQDSLVPQQIVWLDCCHSGELFNFQENSQEAIFLKKRISMKLTPVTRKSAIAVLLLLLVRLRWLVKKRVALMEY
jgi:hypothetical protein